MILDGPSKDGPFKFCGNVHLERSAGQKEARKRFVQKDGKIQERIENGEKIFLAAVPARSWSPQEVTIEQPPPRLNV